ncbi:MAG: CaiB/BaiF CoA transferase family protein [Dehalococcoidia bacterium]
MQHYRPLRGVRVLSFEAAFSLPAATRVLAELGADVVRVGRPAGDFPPFTYRTDGSAINKRSVGINLQHDAGRSLALELAAKADVVCNNFRPHFLRGIGLTYDALRTAKPDIIVLQLSGYGTPGPWQEIGAFGPSVEAAGGMDALIGLGANGNDSEDPPTKVGSTVFADQTAGRYAALAVAMALERRRETGRGRYIDLSMYEGIAHILGDQVLSAARAKKAPSKRGNRGETCAPQGLYPCFGDDEWLALSVSSDAQWQALCRAIGAPNLLDLDAPAASGLEWRKRQHDRIDVAIAAWTRERTKEAAAELLQGHGIPAGPVQKVSDMNVDPHLRFRQAFQAVRHAEPVLGYQAHPHLTLAWQTEGYVRPSLKDARPDGADNRAVLHAWLGLSTRAVAALEKTGALLTAPLPSVQPRNRLPGEPLDLDFAERLGLEPAPSKTAAAT